MNDTKKRQEWHSKLGIHFRSEIDSVANELRVGAVWTPKQGSAKLFEFKIGCKQPLSILPEYAIEQLAERALMENHPEIVSEDDVLLDPEQLEANYQSSRLIMEEF
jgi:hypothetical protein